MKDFWGIVAYLFIFGVPAYAARHLFECGHTALGVLLVIYAFYTVLLRHDNNKQ